MSLKSVQRHTSNLSGWRLGFCLTVCVPEIFPELHIFCTQISAWWTNDDKLYEQLNEYRRKTGREVQWTKWVNRGGRKGAWLRPVVIEHQVGALSAQTDLEGSWLNSHFLSVGCFSTARAAGVYPACTSFYSDILLAVNVLFVPPPLTQAQASHTHTLFTQMGKEEAIMFCQNWQLGQSHHIEAVEMYLN